MPRRAGLRHHRLALTRLALALAALLLAAATSDARAQEEPAAAKAPEQPAAPAVIPLSEIPTRAEAEDRRLRELGTLLQPDAGVEQIRTDFSERSPLFEERRQALADLLPENPSRQRLAEAAAEWGRAGTRVDAWQRALTQRAADLGGEIEALQASEELWKRTRAEAGRSAPPAVRTRIDAVLEQIRKVQREARGRQSDVLTLLDEVSRSRALITESTEQIAAAERELRGRLFEPDAPPLWQALPQLSGDVGSRIDYVRTSLAQEVELALGFVENRRPVIGIHLALSAVLLYCALALRRRVADWREEDPDLGRAAQMLRRPLATTLLVSLSLVPAFYPLAPQLIFDLFTAALLVPLVRLLPPLFPRAFAPLFWALAGFFVLSRLRSLVDADVVVERVLFLLETGGAVAFLFWLMQPARLVKFPPKVRPPRGLGLGLRVALLLLLASLAANLLGYQAFAVLLGDGVMDSTFVGLLLYALFRALDVGLRVILHSRRAQTLGLVRRRGGVLLLWSERLLGLSLVAWWVLVTLERFSIRAPLRDALAAVLSASLSVGAIDFAVGDALAFAFTLAAAWLVSRVIRFVLEEDLFPRLSMQRGLPNAIATLLNYVILTIGFVLALAAAGMDFSRVTLLAGAFGVGVGFGLQNVVNNFVSGLILLFERPVQVGDTVEIGGLLGEVRRIGIRSSTVRTFDGAEVIVPNANLISDQVVNWTLSDRRRRLEVKVGVKYGTDPERVLEILREVGRANETVLQDPAPTALFLGFGDSSLDFMLWAWIPRWEEGFSLRSALAVDVNRRLQEAGIEIPFPQRDLHLRSVDADAGRALLGAPAEAPAAAPPSPASLRR